MRQKDIVLSLKNIAVPLSNDSDKMDNNHIIHLNSRLVPSALGKGIS